MNKEQRETVKSLQEEKNHHDYIWRNLKKAIKAFPCDEGCSNYPAKQDLLNSHLFDRKYEGWKYTRCTECIAFMPEVVIYNYGKKA